MSGNNENNIGFDELIRSLVPINGLSPKYQRQIARQSEIVRYKRGKYVFKQGDRDEYTFYLLEGELDTYVHKQLANPVVSGTDAARYALAQLQPRQLSARAKTDVTVLRIDRPLLDKLLTLEHEVAPDASVEVSEIEAEEPVDWMTQMLQSELFHRIPAANIQRIFSLMEAVPFEAGDAVIRQGEPGDYYYVIHKGRCAVTRKASSGTQDVKLAELHNGDSFGEEALVSDARRNATVTMLTDGELMRLTKNDFVELIKKPTLKSVSLEEGEAMAKEGAVWLDVRFPDEHKNQAIEGSLNVPLSVLRLEIPKLESRRPYVVYCDTGSRSQAGAFLLTEAGLDVRYLAGGLLKAPPAGHPNERDSNAPAPDGQASKASPGRSASGQVAKAPSPAQPVPEKKPVKGPGRQDAIEADVRAAALNAELAKANLQLEDAVRRKEDAEKAKESTEKVVQERLRAEQDKLNAKAAQAKEAVAKAQRLQQEAEAAKRKAETASQDKLSEERKRLEAQAAKANQALAEARRIQEETAAVKQAAETSFQERVRKERERLAAESARANEALAEAQRIKQEVEASKQSTKAVVKEKLRAERARLEAEAARASKALAEAQRLKQETEAAKRKAEAEVARRRGEEEQRIQRLKLELEQKLHNEQQKLASEYSRNAGELEKMQRLKQEGERRVAEERRRLDAEADEAKTRLAEAKRIQAQVEKSRRKAEDAANKRQAEQAAREQALRKDVEAKIREERRKLEAEFAKNAEMLQKAQREKLSAEAVRAAAAQEAERIIEEYKSAHERQREEDESRLRAEREKLEAEAGRIESALADAQRAKEQAEAASRSAQVQAAQVRAAQLQAAQAPQPAGPAGNEMRAEALAAEDSLSQARKELEAAEIARQRAEAARQEHEQKVARHVEVEEHVSQQLAMELEQWREDQDRRDSLKSKDVMVDHQKEHMERIRRKADEAQRKTDEDVEDLLSDVAAQLKDD